MQSRHPLAISIYSAPGVMGVLYLTGDAEAALITKVAGAAGGLIWTWALIIGSALSLLGAVKILPRNTWSLSVESTGCLFLALELGIYAWFLPAGAGPPPWYTTIITWAISLGCLARAVQTTRQRGKQVELDAAIRVVS